MCHSCAVQHEEEQDAQRASAARALSVRDARAQSIILTTETSANDLVIAQRLGVVAAECVFGMHLFKDMFAEMRDLFGGRSQAVQNTLKDARKVALDELRSEAAYLGADAVIGVDLDYSEISGGGKSMLFLVASGTAVKLSKTEY
jgi:uncharacterized protein YbjQ (UPF0145 family)